jgi:hypothetical protein
MPMQKRADIADYYGHLSDDQLPHLEKLRELSRAAARFPTGWFGEHRAEVEAAGFEAGEGFIKLPYDRPLPVDLINRLLQYRHISLCGWLCIGSALFSARYAPLCPCETYTKMSCRFPGSDMSDA